MARGPMVAKRLDVFFDFGSPFAYLLWKLLPAIADRAGLDPVRAAEYHAIEIQIPNPFPVQGARANRLACSFAGEANRNALHTAIFDAAWGGSRDISDADVLSSCLKAAGAPPEVWLEAASSADADSALAANLAAAEAAGVFGVPTMLLGDELFWGIDSLPVLEWRATSR